MYHTRARAENRERKRREISKSALKQSFAITLHILQKEKKVVFTAAIRTPKHLSRPFLEISKRIFDSWIFSHFPRTQTRLIERIKRACLFFDTRAHSALTRKERERDVCLFFFFFEEERRAKERERSSFVLCVSKLNFLFSSFPTKKTFLREEEGKDYYDGDGDIALVDVIFALVFSLGDEFRVLDVVVVVVVVPTTRRANDAI